MVLRATRQRQSRWWVSASSAVASIQSTRAYLTSGDRRRVGGGHEFGGRSCGPPVRSPGASPYAGSSTARHIVEDLCGPAECGPAARPAATSRPVARTAEAGLTRSSETTEVVRRRDLVIPRPGGQLLQSIRLQHCRVVVVSGVGDRLAGSQRGGANRAAVVRGRGGDPPRSGRGREGPASGAGRGTDRRWCVVEDDEIGERAVLPGF